MCCSLFKRPRIPENLLPGEELGAGVQFGYTALIAAVLCLEQCALALQAIVNKVTCEQLGASFLSSSRSSNCIKEQCIINVFGVFVILHD